MCIRFMLVDPSGPATQDDGVRDDMDGANEDKNTKGEDDYAMELEDMLDDQMEKKCGKEMLKQTT